MHEIQITRRFRYNSITLPDPNPALAPEQVREFYASQYPELNNAVVEGPVTQDAVATYTFTRAAGAKGSEGKARSAQDIVHQALHHNPDMHHEHLWLAALQQACDPYTARIAEVAVRTGGDDTQLPIPSTAFGLWG